MSLRSAITFLSRIPAGRLDDGGLAASLPWFPVAGLAIGAVLGAAATLELRLLPGLAGVFLFVPSYFLVKGILHTDGLSDTADALAAHGTVETRDRILRDPHIGVAGAVAVAGFLLGLFVLVGTLPRDAAVAGPFAQALLPLRWADFVVPILAEIAATIALVAAFGLAPLSPTSRIARALAPGASLRRRIGAFAAGAVLLVGIGGVLGIAALVAAVAGATFVGWMARRRFSGLSGDLLGAGHDVTFLLVLLLAVIPGLR